MSQQTPTVNDVFRVQLELIRHRRRLSQAALSKRMAALGHQMHHTAIARIETNSRKVTLDEVFIFARALNVSPLVLLLPDPQHSSTVRIGDTEIEPRDLAGWLAGMEPFPGSDPAAFEAERSPLQRQIENAQRHELLIAVIAGRQGPPIPNEYIGRLEELAQKKLRQESDDVAR